MKYNYIDLHNVYKDTEELLTKIDSKKQILLVAKKYGRYNIECHNIHTDEKIILHDYITRDEVYSWLCGLNTGMVNKPNLTHTI